MVVADLADVDEAVHAFFQFHERAEAGELADLALDELADAVAAGNARPRIFLRLLQAQADALVLRRDLEDDGLDFVALLEHFARVVDLARPAHVGHVDHAVHAFFQLDERAVVGEVADLALHAGADRILRGHVVPRIRFRLADAQGDLLLFLVHVQHDRVHFLAHGQGVGRARDALRPGNLADVHEAFHAVLELHERAVGHEVHDLAADAGALRVLQLDLFPGVLQLLLQAEGNPLLLEVDVQDEHLELLADLHHFARMVDAAPAHVGDVQQAVHAVQIHERAEIGDVLHDAAAGLAGLDFHQQLLLLLAAGFLDQVAARQHDVAALVVDLDDLAFQRLAEEVVQVAHRHHVDLRARQERVHAAHVDQQAALDLALDHAVDHFAFFARSGHVVPIALLFRARLAQHDHPVLVFEALQQHFDFIADVDFAQILEFGSRQQAFRLVADVDQHFLRPHFDHVALDERALGEGLQGFFVHRHHLGAFGVHRDGRFLR